MVLAFVTQAGSYILGHKATVKLTKGERLKLKLAVVSQLKSLTGFPPKDTGTTFLNPPPGAEALVLDCLPSWLSLVPGPFGHILPFS